VIPTLTRLEYINADRERPDPNSIELRRAAFAGVRDRDCGLTHRPEHDHAQSRLIAERAREAARSTLPAGSSRTSSFASMRVHCR